MLGVDWGADGDRAGVAVCKGWIMILSQVTRVTENDANLLKLMIGWGYQNGICDVGMHDHLGCAACMSNDNDEAMSGS
jgi:hypothetical protein